MASGEPLVVLLHGLGRRHASMAGMARALEAAGFESYCAGYPSRRHGVRELAAELADRVAARAGDRPLCAVTHSMGGVVVRHMHDPRLRWRRIVMLAPPNQGSYLARQLSRVGAMRWVFGPAIGELADASSWPPPPAPVAVIAGTRRLAIGNPTSWTFGRALPADVAHDGTVAVHETQLPEMAAFAEVDATHSWIMRSPEVQALTVRYLRTGAF